MRDIRPEGDFVVNGNFTVNEGPKATFIPFDQCTDEQLKQALQEHEMLAQEERTRINRLAFRILCVAIVVSFGLAVWYFISGHFNNAMFLIGLLGVGVPIALALKTGEKKSTFERRQMATISDIKTLLRERRNDT